MSTLRKLTAITSLGALALIDAVPGKADLPPEMSQVLRAKQEFDGAWIFKTTMSPPPVGPGSQGLPVEPADFDGNTMLGRVTLVYQNQQSGGSLWGRYQNMPKPSEKADEDNEHAGQVSGSVRNRLQATAETPDPDDPVAAAAAALKKLERDVVMVVIVDIPDEDEDIVMRYRGTQLRTDMKGTVELGKRNKDGKFEKAGDGTFVARKIN